MSGVSAESFTYDEMASSAEDVFRYTQENSKVPKSVTINGKTAADENYLNMLTNTVVKISNGNKAGSTVPNRKAPSNPQGTGKGTLTKSQYITVAKNINSFYSSNGQAPNFASSAVGDIRYESLIYGFSKVLYAYERDGTLPSEMSFPLVSGISSSGITVDTTPPSTSINLAGGWYNTVKTVTLTASDNKDAGPKVYYRINGGSLVSATKTASISLNQGIWNISYYSKDNKGNTESSKNVLYRIDVTAPTVSKNLAEGYYNNDTTLVLTANDNMDSNPTIYYNINNNGWISNVKTVNIPLVYGTNIVSYYSKDIAGNTGPIQTSTFYLMNTTPTVNSSLEEGTYGITNVTLFVNDLADNNPLIYYSINGGDWNHAYKNTTISLWGGTYVINFYGVNNNGFNSSINSVTYIIDNTPPESSSNIESGEYNQSQLLNISAVDENDLDPSIYYSINYMNFIKANKSLILNLNNGSYFIRYYTMDKYGNKGPINSLMFSIGSNYNVVNLNTNKTYGLLQNAIDDPDTLDGHILEIINGMFGNIYLNKSLTLISKNKNNSLNNIIISSESNGSNISGFTIYGFSVYDSNWVSFLDNIFKKLPSSDIFDSNNYIIIYNSSNVGFFENNFDIKLIINSSNNVNIFENNFSEKSIFSLESYNSSLNITSNSFNNELSNEKNIIYLHDSYADINFNAIFGSLRLINSEIDIYNNYWGAGRSGYWSLEREYSRIIATNSSYEPHFPVIVLWFEQKDDLLYINFNNNSRFDASAFLGKIPEQKIIINTGKEIKEFYTINGTFYYFLNNFEGYDFNVTIDNRTYRVYNENNNSGNVSTGIDINKILNASNYVKNYIEKNHKLPSSVSIDGQSITIPRFLKLLTDTILKINSNSTFGLVFSSVGSPTGPSETMRGGLINSTEYLDIAKRVSNYIVNNGVAPNYASSSLGNVGYNSLIYLFSKILSSYGVNGDLPYFVTIDNWTVISNSNTKFYDEYQIIDAAKRVKNYIETNKKLPTAVVINGQDVSMPTFLKILVTITLNIQGNYYTSVVARSFETASNPAENIKTKNMGFVEYVEISSNIYTFMNTLGYAPNFASSSFGNITYQNLIYSYSKIIDYYGINDYFPDEIVIYPWTTVIGTNTVFFTKNQIINAANSVKSYIETNHALPSSVSIGGKSVSMPQFLKLSTELILSEEGYLCTSFIISTVNSPNSPSENISSEILIGYGNYINITNYINSFINDNEKAPNNAIFNNKTIRYESLVYMCSKILSSYSKLNGTLPDYINVDKWSIVSNSNTVILDMDQIIIAAKNTKSYIESNHILPSSISVSGKTVSIYQFLSLLSSTLLNIDGNLHTSILLNNIGSFNSSLENIITGQIEFEEYMGIIFIVKEYIDSNNQAPGSVNNTSLGENIGFSSLVYMYSNVLSQYSLNKKLPDFIDVIPWIVVSNPGKIYNYDNNKIFESLQDAIDDIDTLNGSVIGIGKNISENIILNKRLAIISIPGLDVVITALNSTKPVFIINTEGQGSIISGLIIMGSTNGAGIYLNNSNYNSILENIIQNNLDGIYLYNSSENTVSDNIIQNNFRNGIALNFNSLKNEISYNNINSNSISGINIKNSNSNSMFTNIISNNTNGIFVNNSTAYINFNAFSNNSMYGLYVCENVIINATNNWWGSNNPKISSDPMSDIYVENGDIIYDPWIILKLESHTDRSHGSNSTHDNIIIADLTHNNRGQDTSKNNIYVPDGILVNFNTSFGSINSKASTKNGKAINILKGTTNNTANVIITLDNQSIFTNSQILLNSSLGVVNTRNGKTFGSIQSAIDDIDTLDGDTISISEGIYTENIVIYKKIILKSVTGAKVIIKPIREHGNIITVVVDGVTINGLCIQGSSESASIFTNANNISIINNIIAYSKYGIYNLKSENSIIKKNMIYNNDYGIYLFDVNSSLLSDNNVMYNGYGIVISNSKLNYFAYNNIESNWNGVLISNSLSIRFHDNDIINNIQGVYLSKTNDTRFYNNNISNNMMGRINYQSEMIYDGGNEINNFLSNNYIVNTSGIIMQSDFWNCGPATLATLLFNLGFNISEMELANLSGTDNTGTSIFNLIHAAKVKGLNLTGMILLSGELMPNDIILLDFGGEYHYSLIKSINVTDVVLADSNFGLFNISREDFDEFYSGYAIIINREVNGTPMVDEQMKIIKGTFANAIVGGISIGLSLGGAVLGGLVIVGVGLIFWSMKTVGSPTNYYGKSSPKNGYYRTSNTIKSFRYSSKTIKYSSKAIRYTNKVSRVLSYAYLAEQAYKKNYQKYLKIKTKELGKISAAILAQDINKDQIKYYQNINKNYEEGSYKDIPPAPKGNESEFIKNGFKKGVEVIKNGIFNVRNGNYAIGIIKIALGTSLIEYISFYLVFSIVPEEVWEK